jgi:hypothetical protein
VLARLKGVPPWVVVLALTAGFAVTAWSGIEQWGNAGGDDAAAYRDYVQWLDVQHRIPRRDQNYEFAVPIGVPYVGMLVQRAFGPPKLDDPKSPPLQVLPKNLRRLIWLALVALGGFALSRSRQVKLIGIGALLAAAAWAGAYVVAAANNEWWLPLVLVSFTAGVLFVPATAWLAHEVWPEERWAPALGATGAVLLPPIFATTLYFHPDPPFALVAVAATALVVRAARTGFTVRSGLLLGVVLGAAGLARQSWPAVAIPLAVAVVLIARRAALPYLAAAAGAMVVTAGWWWYQQWERYGNPIQGNLDRPGYLLDHEPASFFVSFPAALVTRPYIPKFSNELFPRFHAYLWSDWGGNYHHWGDTKPWATTLASVQSVLGFGGDALVLAGVAAIGVPAARRVLRRRAVRTHDAALTVLTALFVLSWAAFVEQLVRYPWREGDTIKVHYLLYLAPVSIVFAVAAGTALVRRGGRRRALLLAWVAAYAVSWALTVATAF